MYVLYKARQYRVVQLELSNAQVGPLTYAATENAMNAMTPIAFFPISVALSRASRRAWLWSRDEMNSNCQARIFTHLENEQEPPGRTTTLLRFSPLHLPLDRLGVGDPARRAARSHGLLLGVIPVLGPQRE